MFCKRQTRNFVSLGLGKATDQALSRSAAAAGAMSFKSRCGVSLGSLIDEIQLQPFPFFCGFEMKLDIRTIAFFSSFFGVKAVHGTTATTKSPTPGYHTLPPLREQAEIQDAWTKERRDNIPKLLTKYGIDAWLVSQREYAEDTAFWSLKWAEEFSSRRRTTLLFLANPSDGTPYSYKWVDNTNAMWGELRDVLEAQKVESIAINNHSLIAFSSGLHAGELEAIREGLGEKWAARLVSEPMLGVEYIGTMPAGRAEWFRRLQSTVWAAISEAFSERVITPGTTTADDVRWWLREKLQQMNYTTWFHPDVTIVDETSWQLDPIQTKGERRLIQYGDLLHVDFGLTALGVNTDTQHLAYVLHPGQTEDDIPQGLVEGLKKGNRLQDIVISQMKVGRTGNEILKAALEQMHAEGIEGRVYCHPVGDWGHSAGPLFGKYSQFHFMAMADVVCCRDV
jgi:hypothetical protein